ncbi:hypothetical protein DVH24_004377 [Malus domestica]|uniref:NADP-dependent oxidoreductase domain-containing protein n=1 Tax=Malus domestica TaxID=3750 RepID=A0A498IGU1_MALDO|nr:hypothetical protein DVH24_004377 [Malus domestica]
MASLCLLDTWNAMEGLSAYGQARGVGVSNFSSKKLQDLLSYAKVPPAVNQDPVLNEIAEKLNKSTAQVCLHWGIQSAHSVLPKSVNESRIKENLSLFDWSIPPELFSKISGHHQQRLLRGDFVVHESLSPYKSVEELWDVSTLYL